MMSSCRKNSILQNAYCKGVLIFLYIIIYLLYWLLISTSIDTPYAVHISDVQYTYTNNLPKFTMTQIMPQNVLLTPIPFGIRNGIIWTPVTIPLTELGYSLFFNVYSKPGSHLPYTHLLYPSIYLSIYLSFYRGMLHHGFLICSPCAVWSGPRNII